MNSTPRSPIERAIRRSAILLLLAFAVEALSLLWKSPLAFFVFMFVSGLLALLGIASYLLSLVASDRRP
ncbi:MAG TPA: hypothetical protein VGQ14_02070 [Candidatus Eisenbacteria bacterium]|jgi:hypothetical protein|nr:hypothetical protein [Candidatus Eisenbacteria bacterium]